MFRKNMLFCDYYDEWIKLYKEGSVRQATLQKYKATSSWLKQLVPTLKVKQLDRAAYQKLINVYGSLHEKQTTMDFHCQVKSGIIDAIEDGLIKKDPTRKVIISGKIPKARKDNYLSLAELKKLLFDLDLQHGMNNDWLIYLIAKTGLRFSEAIALTPADFNFKNATLSVNKTWNYKYGGGFDLTKNSSSIRVVCMDKILSQQMKTLCKNMPSDKPIFIQNGKNIYNSTINDVLRKHCNNVGVHTISLHGLRHTHASVLLYSGVSVLGVSKRLGHSNIAITQKTYLHIIQELENSDNNKIVKSLAKI